jgi:hypothetical protein
MTRFTLAATLALAFAAPVAAQNLSVLLPTLTFPEPVSAPSTKGCVLDSVGAECTTSK